MKQRLFVFIGVSILVVSCGKSYSGRYSGNETLTLTPPAPISYSGYNQPGMPAQPAAPVTPPTTASATIIFNLPEADGSGNITGGTWQSTGAGNPRSGNFSGHANGSGFDNVIMTELNPQPIPMGSYGGSFGGGSFGGGGGYGSSGSYSGGGFGSSAAGSVNYVGSLSYSNNHITGSLSLQNPQQYPSLASTISVDAVKQQ